jgi:GTP cyclohydrolase I
MALRGVERSAEMVTTALRGAMLDDARARAEFVALAVGHRQ